METESPPGQTTPDAEWTPKRVRRIGTTTIALISGVFVIDYIDRVIISLALPSMGAEFGLSKSAQGIIVTVFAVVYMLCQIPGGMLADRVGSRKLLITSLGLWSVFTALTGLTWGLVSLLVVRAVFGIGQGVFPGASFKAMAERTTPGRRATAGGWFLVACQVGAGLGPLLIAPVIVVIGWRHTYWAIALAGAAIGVALWSMLPKRLPARLTGSHDETSASIRSVLRSPAVYKYGALFCAYNMVGYGLLTWVPSYLLEERGIQLVYAGFLSAIPWLVSALCPLVSGWLFDRFFFAKVRLFVVPLLLLSAVLLVLMLNTNSAVVFTVYETLAMVTSGLAIMGVLGMPLRGLPPSVVGTGMGVVNMGGQLAGVLAPLLMGFLIDAYSYQAAFGFLAVSTVAAAALAMTMPRDASEFAVSTRKARV